MAAAFICDATRTPFGRYGGALAQVRVDDLAALPLRALLARNPGLDPALIDEVVLGCANQSGEDNRNVARMSERARMAEVSETAFFAARSSTIAPSSRLVALSTRCLSRSALA